MLKKLLSPFTNLKAEQDNELDVANKSTSYGIFSMKLIIIVLVVAVSTALFIYFWPKLTGSVDKIKNSTSTIESLG